jgi:uncharacterized coiled-coil protein SlyX
MREINSVFVVLLVILIVCGVLGYLVNETGDLNQRLEEKDARIAELEAALNQDNTKFDQLSQQVAQSQADLDAKQKQLNEVEDAYTRTLVDLQAVQIQLSETQATRTQTVADLQGVQQELETKETLILQTQQDLSGAQNDLVTCQADLVNAIGQAAQIQAAEPEYVQMGASQPGLMGLSPKILGVLSAVTVCSTVVVISVLRYVMPNLHEISAPDKHLLPRRVTVKMGRQAYQSYLDSLKTARKKK